MTGYISHIGTKRHSGRYPWGSGNNVQRSKHLLTTIQELKKDGLKDVEIAKALGMSTTELRQQKSLAKSEVKAANVAMAVRLRDKGLSVKAISERMNAPDRTVREWLKPSALYKHERLLSTIKVLEDAVGEHKYIDIGLGVEAYLGISKEALRTAVTRLKNEGYTVHYLKVEQLGTGNETSMIVLAPPGTTGKEVWANRDGISLVNQRSVDRGKTYSGLKPIENVSLDRLDIRYGKDGGVDRDGLIEIRPGVDDLSIGTSKYVQARIGVDGTHYIKGMAVLNPNLPKGVDIRFNTSKESTGNKLDALKKQEPDPKHPFGTTVSQIEYTDSSGKRRVSAVNIVYREGEWRDWSRSLSSQFLSKQSISLAKAQLEKAFDNRKTELNSILEVTNPTVQKHLLTKFADGLDSAAVDLKAAALPRQRTKVLLPVNSLKDNEIYAPTFKDGERVALIRHPHGGVFEIPNLVVNNKNREAKSFMENAIDAVGINSNVAQKLSGADYDGDTVLVIPNDHGKIKHSKSLDALKNFDPRKEYPYYDGMPVMTKKGKGLHMGDISNLITDMTIKGASNSEIARAVKHSMVVIDAEKHKLNYRQSRIDNGIAQLKAKYQGSARSGASTLISKASAEKRVPERSEYYKIDPSTGKKIYKETGATYKTKDGRTVKKTTKTTHMDVVDDARFLSSGTIMEGVYASYANKLKALANDTRKRTLSIKSIPYSSRANEIYAKEVKSLKAKLELARRNKPLERQAQVLANAIVRSRISKMKEVTPDQRKRIRREALAEGRARFNANKPKIRPTKREWEAIQMGAITNNMLKDILNNADADVVRDLATPRKRTSVMDATKINKAKAMLNGGHSNSDVAYALGVSVTTLLDNLNE